jgi:ferredoxin-NADP reductase
MNKISLVVAKKIMETDDTCSLRLEIPKDATNQFRYDPGQFVHIECNVGDQKVVRSYSLSSAPSVDSHFQITVKEIPGGALSPSLVRTVEPGDILEVSLPQGRFFEDKAERAHHYLLFGAGSGVTPLFSILKWVLSRERGDRVTLFFASRRETTVIFLKELQELEARYGERLQVVHVLTRASEAWRGERGRMNGETVTQLLTAYVPASSLPEVAYLCGPVPFMDEVTLALEKRGLPRGNIRRESFTVAEALSASDLTEENTVRVLPSGAEPAPSAPCESLMVRIDGQEAEVRVGPGETILAAILRQGLDAPFSCQEGTCLSCMCRVEAGAVRMKDYEAIGLTEEELGVGVALACLSRPDARHVRLSFEDV